MHNYTFIAYEEENNDMFGIPMPTISPEEPELPSLPENEIQQEVQQPQIYNELPSEIEYVAGKSLISFGAMFAGIIILVLILFFIKKRQQNNANEEYDEIEEVEEIQTVTNEELKVEEKAPEPQQIIRQHKNTKAKLSTPATISQCIRRFLDNTK